MLTQLSTVKSRLALTVSDYDDLLTSAIKAFSARFDKECNRTFARSTDTTDVNLRAKPARELRVRTSHF
jgi:hypothetical protein